LKLFDGLVEVILIDAVVAGADHLHVDAAQHAARVHIIRIGLQQLFRLADGVFQVIGLDVEVGQFFEDLACGRIQLERLLIMLKRFVQVVRAIAVGLSQFRVNAAHRKVVVCAGFGIRSGSFYLGLSERKGAQGNGDQQRFGGTNHDPTLFSTPPHPGENRRTVYFIV